MFPNNTADREVILLQKDAGGTNAPRSNLSEDVLVRVRFVQTNQRGEGGIDYLSGSDFFLFCKPGCMQR